ncbi:MAG: thioredoxin family protein [Alphaproteobacteria bacterium]|nr:thioredoxin family protein [Alphaproteobacteria bacterium]
MITHIFGQIIIFCLVIFASHNIQCAPYESPQTDIEVHTTRFPEDDNGGEFYVVVTFKPKNGWHLYWENPGDSGMPPKANITLPNPQQDTVSLLGYPVPTLHKKGKLTSFIYRDSFSLVYQVNVHQKVKAEDIRIDINWLACKNSACTPKIHSLLLSDAQTMPTKSVQNIVDALPQFLFKGRAFLRDNTLIFDFPDHMTSIKSAFFFPKNKHQVAYDVKQNLVYRDDTFNKKHAELEIKPLQKIEQIQGYLAITDEAGVTQHFIIDHPIIDPPYKATSHNLALVLLLAFIGGLLLNLMPCVFPVLSLKILGLMNYAPTRASTLRHGLSYTLGIFVSFFALFMGITLLKGAGLSVGWGFQLQSPPMVCFLIGVFFLLALNLLGVFEFSSFTPSYKLETMDRHKVSSSFFNGILTTIVATPCTAPFMGTAIAVGLSQSHFVSLGVFTALSLGLSAPFLVLAIWPKLLRYLPKPGEWMIRFKEFLSVPMLGGALWLMWVLESLNPLLLFPMILILTSVWIVAKLHNGHNRKVSFHVVIALAWMALLQFQYKTSMHYTLLYILILISVIYIANKVIECFKIYSFHGIRKLILELGVGFVLSFTTLPLLNMFSTNYNIEKPVPFSKEIIDSALKAGRPVFINYTARWCITCQVNKSSVIESDVIRQLFKEKNVLYVEADWTNYNPEITKSLQEHQRESIPLYVVLRPNMQPIVLPELITESSVREALHDKPTMHCTIDGE